MAAQYQGEVIPNTLPETPYAEIAFFNIKDQSFCDTTLINYCSLTRSKERLDPRHVVRLIIGLTGIGRNAWDCFGDMQRALQRAKSINPDVNEDSVLLLSPFFANGLDKSIGYPWAGGKSNTSILVWKGSKWSSGDNNVYPTNQATVSSYDVLDQIIEHYSDKTIYSNIRHIVVAGHSLGGQTVQRYAAVGRELKSTVPTSYWVANPNSFLWFDSSRPIETKKVSGFNDWKYGLDNYTNNYSSSLINELGPNTVYARYRTRRIAYARGLNDNGDASSSPAPECTGYDQQCFECSGLLCMIRPDRGARFLNFMKAFPPSSRNTVDYIPDVGHDCARMMSSEAGIYRLFLDNFHGDESFHLDFGPREV